MDKYKEIKDNNLIINAMAEVQEGIQKLEKAKIKDDLFWRLIRKRADLQFMVKNWSNALEDYMPLLSENPSEQIILNSFDCFIALRNIQKATRMITLLKSVNSKRTEEKQIELQDCEKAIETDLSKMNLLKNYKDEEQRFILDQLTKRKIKLLPQYHNIPGHIEAPIYLDEAGDLHLPLLIVYPEYEITDYMQDINEHSTIEDCLRRLLESPLPWDKTNVYTFENICTFFEVNFYDEKSKMEATYYYPLRPDDSLIYILTRKKIKMSGFPVIFITSVRSPHYQSFMRDKLICKR